MKKILTLMVVFVSLILNTYGQNSFFPDMGQFFEQGYGDSLNEGANDLYILPTGVKAMAGFIDMPSGDKDIGFWLIDSIGALIQNMTYGGSNNDEAYSIIPLTDKNFIIAGYTEIWNSPPIHRSNEDRKDLFILNIDTAGIIQWVVQYGRENYDNIAYAVVADGSGYMYIVGTETAQTGGTTQMRLMKIDTTGTIVWNNTYTHEGNSITAYDLRINSTGTIICAANEFTEKSKPAIFEIAPDGLELNYYSYNFADDHEIYGMDTALDGGWVFAGRSIRSTDDTGAFVLKTATDFSQDWTTDISNSGTEYFRDIVAADFSYIAAGTCNNRGEGLEDVYIVHLDSFGDTLLHETLGGDSVDFGQAIAKFPNMPVCYVAGSISRNKKNKGFDAFLTATLTEGWKLMLDTQGDCLVPRILFVDGSFVEYPDHPGLVHPTWGIIPNFDRRNILKNFAVKNHFDYLLFYDLDLIFNPPNKAYAKKTADSLIKIFNIYLANLNRKFGIKCGMINRFDSVSFHKADTFVDEYNLDNEGKLHWLTLEHEFWNSNGLPAIQPNGIHWHPYKKNLGINPGNYDCNDHFEMVFKNHIDYLKEMNQIKKNSGNNIKVFDYVQFFFNTWKEFDTIDLCGIPNIYNSDNIDSQIVYAQKVEQLADALFLVYYNDYEEQFDKGMAFLKYNPNTQNDTIIKHAIKYSERLNILGRIPGKNTVIIPLFSNEYVFKYKKDSSIILRACGQDNKFLGNFLYDYDPDSDSLYRVNTLKDVENEYVYQHDSIFNSGIYDSLYKVRLAAFSWFSRDCFVDIREGGLNYDNSYFSFDSTARIPCPDYYVELFPDTTKTDTVSSGLIYRYNNEISVNIYPNPTRDYLIIQFLDTKVTDLKQVNLYDISGKLLYQESTRNSIIYIDNKKIGIEQGVYLIKAQSGNLSRTFKIIIR